MEPCGRLVLSFPIYGMGVLPDGSIAVTGGGGTMKSGIPNACEVHSFNESSQTFSKTGSIALSDAPTALAVRDNVLVTIVGTGCKNFLYKNQKLTAESDYGHDIKVSSSEEQSDIVFSGDGTRLILASDKGPVRVLGYPDCEVLAEVKLHSDGVNDIDISSDGLTVASSARDKCTYLWHSDTGEAIQQLKPVFQDQLRTSIRSVRFSPVDPELLFAVETNPRKGGTWISCWRKSGNGKSPWQSVTHAHALAEAVCSFTVSSDGKLVALSSVEGHVALLSWSGSSFSKIWNTETRTSWFQAAKPSHVLPVTALRFSQSNEYLLTASADFTVAVWPAYKPWNFKRMWKWMKRLTWFFVLLLAYILGEHKLPPDVQQRRVEMLPQLDPYISDFQRTARPVLIQGAEKARAVAVENILPHLEPHIAKFERDAVPVLKRRAQEARAVVFDDILPRLEPHVSNLQRRVTSIVKQGVQKAPAQPEEKVLVTEIASQEEAIEDSSFKDVASADGTAVSPDEGAERQAEGISAELETHSRRKHAEDMRGESHITNLQKHDESVISPGMQKAQTLAEESLQEVHSKEKITAEEEKVGDPSVATAAPSVSPIKSAEREMEGISTELETDVHGKQAHETRGEPDVSNLQQQDESVVNPETQKPPPTEAEETLAKAPAKEEIDPQEEVAADASGKDASAAVAPGKSGESQMEGISTETETDTLKQRAQEERAVDMDDILPHLEPHVSDPQLRDESAVNEEVRKSPVQSEESFAEVPIKEEIAPQEEIVDDQALLEDVSDDMWDPAPESCKPRRPWEQPKTTWDMF